MHQKCIETFLQLAFDDHFGILHELYNILLHTKPKLQNWVT